MPSIAAAAHRRLRAAFLKECGRVFDAQQTACFEYVKQNEHVDLYVYPHRRSPFRERVKKTIKAPPPKRRVRAV